MRKTILLILAFLLVSAPLLRGQDNKEIADTKLSLAIELMDQGVYGESLKLLDEAEALDPGTYIYTYEKAFAWYLQQDYPTAIKLLKKCLKYKDANSQVYQMLGNAYDFSGDPEKALSTYAKGMKKFPNAGRLYMESGVIYLNNKDYNTALSWFEAGINADPRHSSNYYRAAYLYLNSNNKAQGMVYAETFMNLERGTARTEIMSKWLYDGYVDNISFPNDSTVVTDFSNNILNIGSIKKVGDFKIPFSIIYELVLSTATIGVHSVDMPSVCRIRENFVNAWYGDDPAWYKSFSPPVFDYQRKVTEAGHFEPYTWWLLMKGDEDAFREWRADNGEKYDAFVEWFGENPITFGQQESD